MYKAKENGKNQFVFFDQSIEFKIKENTLLEYEIKEALKHNQFTFYLQPKIDLKSQSISGAELLIRWEHPTKGVLYPKYFLQTARNMKIITQITNLALEFACKFIKENREIFKGSLSVNMDSSSMASSEFIEYTKETIKKYDINPSSIEFEILEDQLIKDYDKIVSNIQNLRDFGIKFSIDNFGTGYSSIIYLQKIPIDTIKVDRYFIQNISNKSNVRLIQMVIDISKTFNLSTIIEGVETKEQLDFITEKGANQYQGFYFSRAVEEKNFLSLLKENYKNSL